MTIQRTTGHNLGKLPNDAYHTIFSFASQEDLKALQLTNQKIRNISTSTALFRTFIRTHFKSALSATLSPIDQYEGLKIGQSKNGRMVRMLPSLRPTLEDMRINLDAVKKALIQSGKKLQLCDLTTGRNIHTLELSANLSVFAVSRDGERAITLEDDDSSFKVWDLITGECTKTLEDADDQTLSLIHLSHDGRKLLRGGQDGSIRIIDIACQTTHSLENTRNVKIKSLILSNDGSVVVAGYRNGYIDLWDCKTMEKIGSFKSRVGIKHVQITKNNEWLVSVDVTGTLKIWDIKQWKCIETITKKPKITPRHLQISANSELFIISYMDGTIILWNSVDRKIIKKFKIDDGLSALSPVSLDGTTIATTTNVTHAEFTLYNLAPLPQDRIHDAAMAALNNDEEACDKFEDLPLFVQKIVNSYAYHRQTTLANCYVKGSITQENKRVYEGLCKYNVEAYLPEIVKLLRKASVVKSEQSLTSAALHRFQLLPEDTKNLIYWRLSHIHKLKGKLPSGEKSGSNYGQNAFNDTSGDSETTNGERILAIEESFTSVQEARKSYKKFCTDLKDIDSK